MLVEIFADKWPTLNKAINLVGADNGMIMKPNLAVVDFEEMERMAKLFTPEELELICCGEQEEAEALLISRASVEFGDFLNEVFDGIFTDSFYDE